MMDFTPGDLVTGILRRDWLGEVLEIETDGAGTKRAFVRWLKPENVWPNPRLEVPDFLVYADAPGLKPIRGGADLGSVCSDAMPLARACAEAQAAVKRAEVLRVASSAIRAACAESRAKARHERARRFRGPVLVR